MSRLESILIVDDEPGTVRVLASVLEDAGYRVDVASDGRAALEQLDARPVHLVLLDYLMPNLDGCETLRAIRKDPRTASLPVIMMSGMAESMIERRCRSAYDLFLRKPFSLDDLLAAVRAMETGRAGASKSKTKTSAKPAAKNAARRPPAKKTKSKAKA